LRNSPFAIGEAVIKYSGNTYATCIIHASLLLLDETLEENFSDLYEFLRCRKRVRGVRQEKKKEEGVAKRETEEGGVVSKDLRTTMTSINSIGFLFFPGPCLLLSARF